MTIKHSLLRIRLAAGLLLLAIWLMVVQTGLFVSAQGERIQYGQAVTGSIAGPEDQDTWVFDGRGGDIVAVRIDQTTGSLVPAVSVQDPDGVLLVSLESPGEAGTPLSFSASLRTSGPHTVTVSSVKGTTGEYSLTLQLIEPGDESALGEGTLAYGRAVSGEINDDQFRQFWTFRGGRDDVIDILMTNQSGDLQPFVSLIGPEGTVLASSQTGATADLAALYAVRLPGTGVYTVVARRDGGNFGETGTTAGTYNLLVTLRQPGANEGVITPITLMPGTATRGRLVADAPAMFYSTQATAGILSIELDLLDPYQVATVAVMTPDRAVIDLASGSAPLRTSTALSEKGEVWIEVSAANISSQAPVDFELTAWQFVSEGRGSRPLTYGIPQQVSASTADDRPAAWHFVGNAGDMVEVELSPFAPVLEGNLRVTGPDGSNLVSRAVNSRTVQPLVLTQDGIYEVLIDQSAAAGGYQIAVERIGMKGRAFDQRAVPEVMGILRAGRGEAIQADLAPGTSHAWEVDIIESHTWAFKLEQVVPGVPMVLAVESPDGNRLGMGTTERPGSYALVQVHFPRAGRYRIIVSDLVGTQSSSASYVLWAEPVEGGTLSTHIPAKGVLSPGQPVDVWDLTLPPDTLLNLRVRVLAGASVPPIAVLGPNGQLITSNLTAEQSSISELAAVPIRAGGPHRVMVGQPNVGQYIVYQIDVDRVVPFETQVNLAPAQPTPVPEVFVISNPATEPWERVPVADQVAAPIALDMEVLGSAPRIETELLIRGEISLGQAYQVWSLDIDANRVLGFSVAALDSQSSPDLIILDQNGQVLAERRQADSSAIYLMHRFPSSGVYYAAIGLGQEGRYTLWVDALSGIDERVSKIMAGHAAAYGGTISGELIKPGDSLPLLFFGHADDVIYANAVYVQGEASLFFELLTPDGERLAQVDNSGVAGPVVLAGVRLPSDGVYRVVAVRGPSERSNVCRVVIHLNLQNARASTERGGGVLGNEQIARLSLGDPVHRWLFDGQSGEQVTIRIEPLASGVPTPFMLQVTDTQGQVFAQRAALTGQGAVELSGLLLPRTGVYQAVVRGGDRQPGLYRVILTRDPASIQDNERAIRYGETAGKVLSARNFLDIWTFAGTRGDVVRAHIRPVRGDMSLLNVQLRTGDGLVLATAAGTVTGAPVLIEAVTLPVDGHYSLVVGNPDGSFTGEMAYELTVDLQQTPARSMGSVIAVGQTVQGTFYADDRVDVWLFEGQQGDTITLELNGTQSGGLPSLALISTDWHVASVAGRAEVLAFAQATEEGPARIVDFALPFSGPYALAVQSATGLGGDYRLSLSRRPVPVVPTRAIRAGQQYAGQISPDVPSEAWTFEGSIGQLVTISVTSENSAELLPSILLVDPDGVARVYAEAASERLALITRYRLDEMGQYTVLVAQAGGKSGRGAGRYTLHLEQMEPESLVAKPVTYGQLEFAILDTETPSARWTFSGQAGDVVRIRAEVTDGNLDPVIELYSADGKLLAAADDGLTEVDAEINYVLSIDGTYQVVAARYGNALGITTGSCRVIVERVYRTQALSPDRLLVYGDRVAGTTDTQTPVATWFFAGEQGDMLTAKIQFPLDDAPLSLSVLDPAGNTLAVSTRDRGDARIEGFTLPASGLYQLEVRRPDDARSRYNPYTLELALVGALTIEAQQGGTLLLNRVAAGQFIEAPAVHNWVFQGQSEQVISLSVTRLSGALALEASLLAPDGSLLLGTVIESGTVETLSTQPVVLPLDGTYTLSLSGSSAALGGIYRILVQPAVLPEVVAELTPLTDRFGLITDAQPQQTWAFEGQVGDAISIRVAALSDNLEPTLLLWGPDGRPLAEGQREQVAGSYQVVLSRFVISQQGTYRVTVGRVGGTEGQTLGKYRVMLRREAISSRAALATDVAFGQRVTGYTRDADGDLYAFQGLAGDVVALSVQAVGSGTVLDLHLEREDGTQVEAPVMRSENEISIPTFILPEDGRYIAAVQGSQVIEYTLILFRREQQSQVAPLKRNLEPGRDFIEGISDPAQPTHWLFSGSLGQVFSFIADSSGSGLRVDMALYGPDGAFIASATEQAGTRVTTLGPLRLPASGEYVLVVGAWLGSAGGTTGQYTVRMQAAEPGISGSAGGHLIVREIPVSGGLIAEDPEDIWTFDGQAGEVIAVRVEQIAGEGILAAEIRSPEGESLAVATVSTAFRGVSVPGLSLPVDGVYTLVVHGSPVSAIEYCLSLMREQSPLVASIGTAQGIRYGESQTGVFRPGAAVYQGWVFWGQSGEQIGSRVVPADAEGLWELYLIAPDGKVLAVSTRTVLGDPVEISGYALPATGFYGLIVSLKESNSAESGYTISLENQPSGAQDQGTLDGEATGILTPSAAIQTWTLLPRWSGDYAVQVVSLTAAIGWNVSILSSDGSLLATGTSGSEVQTLVARLEAGERYTALISTGPRLAHSQYRIRFEPAAVLVGPRVLLVNTPNMGRINHDDFTNEWQFDYAGDGGTTQVSIEVSRVSGDLLPVVSVVDANGVVLAEQQAGQDGVTRMTVSLPVDGRYALLVSRAGRAAGRTVGEYVIVAHPAGL